jgi:hypothetical protein
LAQDTKYEHLLTKILLAFGAGEITFPKEKLNEIDNKLDRLLKPDLYLQTKKI